MSSWYHTKGSLTSKRSSVVASAKNSKLVDLLDVNTTNIQDGDVLVFNSKNKTFQAQKISSNSSASSGGGEEIEPGKAMHIVRNRLELNLHDQFQIQNNKLSLCRLQNALKLRLQPPLKSSTNISFNGSGEVVADIKIDEDALLKTKNLMVGNVFLQKQENSKTMTLKLPSDAPPSGVSFLVAENGQLKFDQKGVKRNLCDQKDVKINNLKNHQILVYKASQFENVDFSSENLKFKGLIQPEKNTKLGTPEKPFQSACVGELGIGKFKMTHDASGVYIDSNPVGLKHNLEQNPKKGGIVQFDGKNYKTSKTVEPFLFGCGFFEPEFKHQTSIGHGRPLLNLSSKNAKIDDLLVTTMKFSKNGPIFKLPSEIGKKGEVLGIKSVSNDQKIANLDFISNNTEELVIGNEKQKVILKCARANRGSYSLHLPEEKKQGVLFCDERSSSLSFTTCPKFNSINLDDFKITAKGKGEIQFNDVGPGVLVSENNIINFKTDLHLNSISLGNANLKKPKLQNARYDLFLPDSPPTEKCILSVDTAGNMSFTQFDISNFLSREPQEGDTLVFHQGQWVPSQKPRTKEIVLGQTKIEGSDSIYTLKLPERPGRPGEVLTMGEDGGLTWRQIK